MPQDVKLQRNADKVTIEGIVKNQDTSLAVKTYNRNLTTKSPLEVFSIYLFTF